MFARGVFSFYPPRLHASTCFPSKSFVSPIYKITGRNSFVSPTYAKIGGIPPQKCRRADIFSLFPLNPQSRSSCFSIIYALFHFPYHTYPPHLQEYAHSYAKTGGTPPGHINSPRPSTSALLPPPPPLLPLPPSFPFTAHSQICYRAFTHPSLALVTMEPSQGTNSYTMPTVNTRPTVHFYRCDPPGEIRS